MVVVLLVHVVVEVVVVVAKVAVERIVIGGGLHGENGVVQGIVVHLDCRRWCDNDVVWLVVVVV